MPEMSTYVEASVGGKRQRLGVASTVARFALIGVVLAVAAGGFVYLGGWLTPSNLTPVRFVDAFQRVTGVHAGFRRNHAKGVGESGFFESNGNGERFSRAVVFRPGRRKIGSFHSSIGLLNLCPPEQLKNPEGLPAVTS